MSASSPRRLPLWLLVVSLAIPSQASAASWELGNLLARAGGFFSAVWGQVGCVIEPSGQCGSALRDHGCVILPDGRCAADPHQGGADGPVLSEVGCEINPTGSCGS